MGVKKHADEVDLILNDIRDTLLPNKNPDCTFITRRQDKRLQERLLGTVTKFCVSYSGLGLGATL